MVIKSFSLWAPGVETKDDWMKWYVGEKEIDDSSAAPKITFASPITTRRFSQLTKMTCYMANHLGIDDVDGLFFTSVRGEIEMQYKINAEFAMNNETKPAAFAISVFNTAPAQATILLKSKIPYTPVFSGFNNVIRNLVIIGSAPIKTSRMKSSILIYAEEKVPYEYRNNLEYPIFFPLCIGIKLSAGIDDNRLFTDESLKSPTNFARYLIETKQGCWL